MMNRGLGFGLGLVLMLGSGGCRERAAAHPDGDGAAPSNAPAGWGSLSGRIQVTGAIPPDPVLALPAAVAKLCGETSESKTVVVGQDRGLQDAVVWLESPAVPRNPGDAPATVVMDQRRCVYRPRVVTARAGDILEVRNSDDLLHNVRAGEGTRTWFNLAMPFAGMSTRKPLPERAATIGVGCDVHPWMKAWVKSFDHPWFAQTGADGRFLIRKAPAGPHTIHLWHERFPERRAEVGVTPGGTARFDFSF